MNNHFEDLRINLGNYRNGNFQSINVLNNLKNYLNHWIVCFRNNYMDNNFTIPSDININLELEDTVYRFSNTLLFERRQHRDIIRWVLILLNLCNTRLYNLDYGYVPDAPFLFRLDNSIPLQL